MQVPRRNHRRCARRPGEPPTVEGGVNVLGDVDADRARADLVGAAGYTLAALRRPHRPPLVDALFSVRYRGPELT